MKMLLGDITIEIDVLSDPMFTEKDVSVSVARLDKIHPVISGNKLFKLHYFLEEAIEKRIETIITFGGAYSNHLVATAYACKIAGLRSIGIVRGEKPPSLSHSLQQCEADGMQLQFISREVYGRKEEDEFIFTLKEQWGDALIIPEGGYHPLGAKGASLIMSLLRDHHPTHICIAVGTATTLAGLLMKNGKGQLIGIPVLKNMTDLHERIRYLGNEDHLEKFIIFDDYHFGGYAKKTTGLLNFMNEFFIKHAIPTDFVYTAKMMYGMMDKISKDFFPAGSRIVCIHTGGLQGNDSLAEGALVF